MYPEYDVSVLVLTYNSSIKKLFSTLSSIILQEGISFEIVISDDGSINFDSKPVIKWFKKHGFQNFKILAHECNQGTVINYLSAINASSGKYIKAISPGDFLYDCKVLKSMVDCLKKNSGHICFGRAVYYSVGNRNEIFIKYFNSNPVDFTPYKKKKIKLIQRHYLYYRDYILGANFLGERNIMLDYITIFAGKVVYAEDCSVIAMVADGILINFLDQNVIWYEYGTGISTSASVEWQERINRDNLNCFEIISKRNNKFKLALDLIKKEKGFKTFYWRLRKKLFYLHCKVLKCNKLPIKKDLEDNILRLQTLIADSEEEINASH